MAGQIQARAARASMAGPWMMGWGVLDLAYFAHYVIASIGQGRVPLLGELAIAADTAGIYGNRAPVWLTAAAIGVYASLPVSGVLLLRRQAAGLWLAAAQTGPRWLLAVPTGAVLLWPGGWPARLPATAAVALPLALLVLVELLKLGTLVWPRLRRAR